MKKKSNKNKDIKKISAAVILSAIIVSSLLLSGFLVFDKIIMPEYARTGEEYPVPDIRGYNIEQAKGILKSEGFVLSDEITQKTDYDNPAGRVLAQYPKPGSESKLGRNVFVTVSTGALPVIVPNLIGLSPRDAQYRVAESRLYLDSIMYEFSTDFPEGVVMGQSLVENDSVSVGDSLFIVVSTGRHPTEFIVPDLREKILEQAAETIDKQGFELSEVVYIKNEDFLPNTVLDQKPDPEEVVYEGAEIRLLVSSLEEPEDPDSLKTKEKVEKFNE
ncbi:MAG: PASTA domain-containing protein [Candidatus Delongbacteria bacterium]